MTAAKLIVAGLGCVRGWRTLYDGLSFSLAPGEAVLVSGPNGSGKTSLLRQVAGLLRLDAGSVRFGEDGVAERAHFLGHADAIKGALSVEENLMFWHDFYGGVTTPAAALERVKLSTIPSLPARALSAGQRKRLALARLLVAPRPLWLLDEPEAALDREGKALLGAMLDEHHARGGMAMIASHGGMDFRPTRELMLGISAGAAA